MKSSRLLRRPPLVGVLIALGFALLPLVPAPAQDPGKPNRDERVAEIQRQIAELQKQLAELQSQPKSVKPAGTEAANALPDSWVKSFTWRSIGPASMGGRIVDFAVSAKDPTTYWVATASGGLLKTTNNGVTFTHQFDHENTVSIGDVAVAPSDPNIVWVGTGENNPRNSVSYGDGVYKSTDGGKTWKHMGLRETFQIGRIAIHPENPDIVYVGALGRLYGPNPERGLFKTTDGGKTWKKVLFVDDKTGVIDLRMSPADPNTLLVATYERQRDGFDGHAGAIVGGRGNSDGLNPPLAEGYDAYDPIKKWGPGSGIHKTTDGGKTWKKLTNGLPTCEMGRIGLDFYRKDPNVVFAIIETQKIGMGTPPSQTYLGVQIDPEFKGVKLSAITNNSPAAKGGLKEGDVVEAADKKPIKTSNDLLQAIRARKPGDKLPLTIQRGGKKQEITITLGRRPRQGGQRPPVNFRGEDTPKGVKVTRLFSRGPGAPSGLQVNDVILTVDKKKVTKFADLVRMLADVEPDKKVTLTVQRGKEVKTITFTPGTRPERTSRRPWAESLGGQRANAQDQQGPNSHEYGGVYKSADAGETWVRINSINPRPMYFSQVRVDPSDDNYLYVLGVGMMYSKDAGKTFNRLTRNVHADQHAMWIDPRDGRHMMVGTDGGFYVSFDRGATWDFHNDFAIGQFYHVCLDPRKNYRVFGGLQDNGSWGGPSRTLEARGPINADWFMVSGGDGFVCRVDPSDPDLVYFESQNGRIGRRNLSTGERGFVRARPPRSESGSPAGRSQRAYRYNWNTPFILSSHNPKVFYSAGNMVFRSLDRGNDLKPISPELTNSDQASATALSESPRDPDVLWAGTDDGNLWVTRDGGENWTNVVKNVGLEKPLWVATIEASRFAEGRAYVCFDGHRSDDDNPNIFVTEDFGKTWKSIRANLPWGSSRCLREDLVNPDLLYCGTEFAIFASLDRGGSWTKINNNLPTVAVHEVALHPTQGELVAATHGRSLWILDVTPLRQMKPQTLKEAVTLYQPATAIRWRSMPQRGTMYGSGHRGFSGTNPTSGGVIYYSLAKPATKVSAKVVDYAGRTVRELPIRGGSEAAKPGLHRLVWDLRGRPASRTDDPNVAGRTGRFGPGRGGFAGRGTAGRPSGSRSAGAGTTGSAPGRGRPETGRPGSGRPTAGQPGGGRPSTGRPGSGRPTTGQPGSGRSGGGRFGGRFGRGGGSSMPPGMYRVVLTVDDQEYSQPLRIESDPDAPAGTIITEDEDQGYDFDEEEEEEGMVRLFKDM